MIRVLRYDDTCRPPGQTIVAGTIQLLLAFTVKDVKARTGVGERAASQS
jgi:hypothetical protein